MSQKAVRELRTTFDQIFASPPASVASGRESFLAIRLRGDGFALRLEELAGLEGVRHTVSVPGGRPGLLGIVGIRSRTVPAYSLEALLGYGDQASAWRWLALCGRGMNETVALAFADLEGLLQASRDEIHPVGPAGGREHVHQVVRAAGRAHQIYGVVSIDSILKGIRARPDQSVQAKER